MWSIEPRAWGLQPPLHTIRMNHNSSLCSNSMHLCIIYPLFVCYRLTQWALAPLLSPQGEIYMISNVGKPTMRFDPQISCMFKVLFKRSSLPQLIFAFLWSTGKKQRTNTGQSTKRTIQTAFGHFILIDFPIITITCKQGEKQGGKK